MKEAVYQDREPEAPVAKEASEQAAPGSFIGDLGQATEVKAEPIDQVEVVTSLPGR